MPYLQPHSELIMYEYNQFGVINHFLCYVLYLSSCKCIFFQSPSTAQFISKISQKIYSYEKKSTLYTNKY
jgi:hypothetical protein